MESWQLGLIIVTFLLLFIVWTNRKKKLIVKTENTLKDKCTNVYISPQNESKELFFNKEQGGNDKEILENVPMKEPKYTKQEIETLLNEYAKQIVYDHNNIGYVDLSEIDPLFTEAAKLIVIQQMGSTSLIQRKFAIGYNRAGRIMDQLEVAGIVGAFEGSKAREVLIKNENALQQIFEKLDGKYFFRTDDSSLAQLYFQNSELIQEKIKVYEELKEREEEEYRLLIEKEAAKKRVLDKKRKRDLEKQVTLELIESGELYPEANRREPIPKDIIDAVWNRDGGKCVYCGSNEKIHIDHIIPFSKGGANTVENLQILCQKCNLEKSDKIG